jgi:hypothetical protein
VTATDPRFARWDREGAVGVQIQATAGKPPFLARHVLGGEDSRVAIDPVDASWTPSGKPRPFAPTPGSRRAGRFKMLRLRVQSDDKGRPVWAAWPMLYARPLPDDAVIKRVRVGRRMIGPREEWSTEITVSLPDPPAANRHAGAVSLHIGWRKMGDEIRVAVWRGEDGASGELRLDAHTIASLRKAGDIQEIRSVSLTRIITWLAGSDELDAHGATGWLQRAEIPDWMRERTRTMREWRSAARLVALWHEWSTKRFPGDAEGFERLSAWRHDPDNKAGDRHLWLWETSQRTGSLRRRDYIYKRFAKMLAERYDTLVISDFDLRDVARRGELGAEKGDNEMARSHRQIAAPSKVRDIAKPAFLSRGGTVVKERSVDSTHTCPECGLVSAFDAAKMITWRCDCGATHDQDESAARVLLEQWLTRRERLRVEREAAAARGEQNVNENKEVKESRWTRARRMSAEKKARAETARKSTDNAAE